MNTQTAARLVSGVTVLVASTLLSGCATKQDVRDMQAEIRAELQQLAAQQQALLTEFRLQTMQTQDTLQSASRELVDIRGTLLREIRNNGDQIARLAELVGQNQSSITQIRDEMGRAGARSAPGFGSDRGMRDPMMSGVDAGADEAYNAAMTLYQRGSNDGARAEFLDFLERFPNDAELGPLVHYNLGDIAVQQDDPELALEHFRQVRELWPNSDKVAEALYRIGLIQMDQGDTRDARRTFDTIVNTYGDRDSVFFDFIVSEARDRLREIGG